MVVWKLLANSKENPSIQILYIDDIGKYCFSFPEAGHFYEATTVSEESKCDSDSVFYKQTEGNDP